MNIREELLQELYNVVINNGLYPRFCDSYGEALKKNNLFFTEESKEHEEMEERITYLAHDAFITGAAAVLDFIAGRDGKAGVEHA